jgi:hypothetical protein
MNTKRKSSSKLLWLGSLVLVLVAGTAMAGDHHRGVRSYGSYGYYGAPAVVYSNYPVYVSPPTVVYGYSQPYYAPPCYVQPYYAPSIVVGGYWGGSGYYGGSWGHYGSSRHHR